MATQALSSLKIGLLVEHKSSTYKIIDNFKEPYARKYVIQSVTTGATKIVFRHEICEVSISSAFFKLTEETIFNVEKDSQSDDEMLDVDIPEPVMKKTQT